MSFLRIVHYYFCQVDRETDFLMHAHSMTDREGQGLISEEYNIEEEVAVIAGSADAGW